MTTENYITSKEISNELRQLIINSKSRSDALKVCSKNGIPYRNAYKLVTEIFADPEVKKFRSDMLNADRNLFNSTQLEEVKQLCTLYGYKKAVEIIVDKYNISRRSLINKLHHMGLASDSYDENEEFVKINDFYEISKTGIVRKKIKAGYRTIKPTVTNRGYCRVTINGKGELIHRLVAKAFIPNPENKGFVDHIDTNRQNNRVENLRWVTSEENMNNELTRRHVSISKGCSSVGFTATVIDETTGEVNIFNSMAQLYKYFGLEYIPKYVGIQTFRDHYSIIMQGEDNDEYLIGKMLRHGTSKEQLIDKIQHYSENREYTKYLKS